MKASDLEYAREKRLSIKLIAQAKRIEDTVYAFVMPQFIKSDHTLTSVKNEFNAVIINGEFCDDQLFIGKGAGSLPTGAAVLSDISALSYNYRYEYKKHYNLGKLPFSNDSLLEVYVSFENPHEINLEDFESIQHKYFSFDHSYVIGKMCINNLLDEKWLNNPKKQYCSMRNRHRKHPRKSLCQRAKCRNRGVEKRAAIATKNYRLMVISALYLFSKSPTDLSFLVNIFVPLANRSVRFKLLI